MAETPTSARTASSASRPHPLGVHPLPDGGVHVAVLAAHADRVQLCLLDPSGDGWSERRIDLPHRTHGVWHGVISDVPLGQRYGLRVHGPWNPRHGHRHNPAKLLLDPYARAVLPPRGLPPQLFAHPVGRDLSGDPRVPDHRDSAPWAPLGVVIENPPAAFSTRPQTPWTDTVIYEAHVRGLTMMLPGVPPGLRGTYAGLAHPATVDYLTRLGVTTIELLPVHASAAEPHLARRGMPNYWGYSTLGFFAPHLPYAAASDPAAAVAEFRAMVAALHDAGLEVLLDVVYNHTAETGVSGPDLSFRGLDATSYYRLDSDGRDVDFTGCGNTLDATSIPVIRMVMDSLRYWVECMDVDGFRFDLAVTLARGRHDFEADHPLLVAMRTDPVLDGVKLIAEPWDVGPDGWRTGNFPAPFAEWNDKFRDDVREFWLPGTAQVRHGQTAGGLRDLGTRIAGSADTFADHRGPLASINFVTAHDGFSLTDLVSYNEKHNQDNGEDNRDGTSNNRSWNHGPEGATDNETVLTLRRRSQRNLLATLLFSSGVPMLLAGDELGRSQLGNNNAYCQDNEISWLDWRLKPWQEDLLATTQRLIQLRREFPVLRPAGFFTGDRRSDGSKDLSWFGPDGVEMTWQRWEDAQQRVLQVLFGSSADSADSSAGGSDSGAGGGVLLMVSGAAEDTQCTLPPSGRVQAYELLWDSVAERPGALPRAPQLAPAPPPR
jgi:isoamylase